LQEELDQSADVSSRDKIRAQNAPLARRSARSGAPVMQAPFKTFLAFLVGGLAFVAVSAIADHAVASNCGCTPPPCCTPPSPPPPPQTPCCQPPGHTVNIPGVNVNVSAAIVVNAQVSAQVGAQAGASGTVVVSGGGGGGGYFAGPGTAGLIQNFNVEGGQMSKVAYEASRTITKKVVIQAFCLDDKDVPHPASQVTPDRDIDDAYDNELYRCIAGTHMQYTIASYAGQIDFGHGQTLSCQKGDALYHSPGGKVECRVQKPARDCNERSLLRRFGAGVKILTMITIEKYTAYREEVRESSSGGALSLDGGVGGVVY
jgi:hypothetical protein